MTQRLALRRILPAGTFRRGVAVIAGGTALGQAVAILAAPLLTRLYEPRDFGLLSVYSSIFAVLYVVSCLRYELGIPLAESRSDAMNVLYLSFAVAAGMSLLTLAVVALLANAAASWIGAPRLAAYLWVLPGALLVGGAYQALSYWALRNESYSQIGRSNVAQGVGQTVVQLGAGTAGAGAGGLVVGDAAGYVAESGILFFHTFKSGASTVVSPSLTHMRRLSRRFRRFPLFSSWSGLLNSAGVQLPAILFAGLFGPAVAGWFAIGQRLIAVPMWFLGQAVSQVYFGQASSIRRTEPAALEGLYARMAVRLLLIGLVPLTLIGLLSPWVFPIVFGSAWRVAGEFAQVLAPAYLVQFVVVPLSQTLNVVERQDVQLVWDASRLAVIVSAIVIASRVGLSAYGAVVALALASGTMYLILFFITRQILRRGAVS